MTNAVNLASLAVSGALSADSSGNVGIGTTTPGQKLDVRGSGNTYLRIEDTQANGYNAATLYKNDQRQFRVGVLGTVGGFTNGALVVYDETAAAWRMVIDSSGRLLVGTTSTFDVTAGATTQLSGACAVFTAGSPNTLISFYNSTQSARVGFIGSSGNSTQYNSGSDYRLKDNVTNMSGALSKISDLRPVTFTWKAAPEVGLVSGFIAHELDEVVPEAVSGEKDAMCDDGVTPNYQMVDQSKIVPLLVAAIQELKAEVDQLRAQLEAK